jgi:hypothetical protein
MPAWKLPLIVAAITLPLVAGFLAGALLIGGPALGFVAGALAVLVLLVVAARQRPRGPIGELPPRGGRRRVLVVAACPVEEPAIVAAVAREVRGGARGEEAGPAVGRAEVLVLAPASIGFLDRWASDVEGSRRRAQERLVTTVAALAQAGVVAEARVGDEDVVQAVEDQLQKYAADEVILVTDGRDGADGEAAAAELSSRLRARFRHLAVEGG